ncbi:MAG TPA: class I SAM-dependent methyltransferase [Blastocatellia bacterium]|nr:class I SAM-dependent methyltransferase [Blastocatellia bacterium]
MTAEQTNDEFPLKMGSPEEFERLESLFRSSGFDEQTVCRALKISDLSRLGETKLDESDPSTDLPGRVKLLIRLFLLMEAIGREEAGQYLDEASLDLLLGLDVLRVVRADGGEAYFATVLISPVAGLLIASDRYKNVDGSPFIPPADVVFPPIFLGTLRFLKNLRLSPVRDALDLCSGSGVAALVLSRHAERVVASDITARATHFAEFNRRLNRCLNVEVVRSDLYSAMKGRTFDYIVSHPPYMPSLSNTFIYRDGGATGEELVKAVVEGVPEFLRPGGTFYCVSAGWDTTEGPFESRLRGWLSDHGSEFDIIFALFRDILPEKLANDLAERAGPLDPSESPQWIALFRKNGMRRLVYGAMTIHRRAGREEGGEAGPPALTQHLRLGALTDGSCFEWMLGWQRWRARKEAGGELASAIAGLRPRLGNSLQVKVTYTIQQGTLVASEVILETERPFQAATRIDLWAMPVTSNFDGGKTVAEVFENARAASMLPEDIDLNDFSHLVANMIERGYLELDRAPFG